MGRADVSVRQGAMTQDQTNEEHDASASDADPPEAVERTLPPLLNVLGWVGTLAILGAYAGISFGWLERGVLYQVLNLGGAAGVGGVCWARRTWQPLFLQVVWAGVAALALAQLL